MFVKVVDGPVQTAEDLFAQLGTTPEVWEQFQEFLANGASFGARITPVTLPEAMTEYLESGAYVGLGHSPATRVTYATTLGLWHRYFKAHATDVTTDAVSVPVLQGFLLEARSESTWNKRLTLIRAFFDWCVKREYARENPMHNRQLRYKRQSKSHRPAVLNKRQARQLCEAAKESRYAQRNHLLLMLFLETGVRLSEALGLRESRIDFQQNKIHIEGKGRKHRWLELKDPLRGVLKEYVGELPHLRRRLRVRGEFEDCVFYSHEGKNRGKPLGPRGVQDMVQRCLAKLDIASERDGLQMSTHKLRHTFAVRRLVEGTSLPELRDMLGHNSVETTMLYLVALSDAELRQHLNSVTTVKLTPGLQRKALRIREGGYKAIEEVDGK